MREKIIIAPEMNLSWGLLHAGLQTVLDTALDPVVVMSTDGEIIGWNDLSAACFGWSWAEVRGRRLSDVIIPEHYRPAHEAGLAHYHSTGEGPVLGQRIEVEALHRDGHTFPVELSVTASEQFGDKMFIGFLRDISERREEAERQQRILQESEHRVKNMLTVVQAIATQTAQNSPDIQTFSTAFAGRLASLAQAHELLTGKVWHNVAISALVDRVLGPEVCSGRARYGGPEQLLNQGQVLGLSMILHELYTNSIKYGAMCGDDGHIDLSWRQDGDMIELEWSEYGGTCHADVPSSGFGQRMIAMSVKSDLKGTIEREWRDDGLRVVLRFPVAN